MSIEKIELVSEYSEFKKFAKVSCQYWIDSSKDLLSFKYCYSFEKDGVEKFQSKPSRNGKVSTSYNTGSSAIMNDVISDKIAELEEVL